MVRTQRLPGWLSLPEAAQAVHVSLPVMRYLARRLALPLGVSLDVRGDAYIPESKLELLRQVAAYRSQGYTIDEIEGLLQAPGPEPRHDFPPTQADPERTQDLGAPAPGPRPAPRRPTHEPGDRSLPFPFPEAHPHSGEPVSHPQASQALGRNAIESLRAEMEAIHRENQELRQRLETLMLWIQEREMLLEAESLKNSERGPSGAWETPQTTSRGALQVAAAGDAAGPVEAPQVTRTPYGHRRRAVVRQWRPPVLNGKR